MEGSWNLESDWHRMNFLLWSLYPEGSHKCGDTGAKSLKLQQENPPTYGPQEAEKEPWHNHSHRRRKVGKERARENHTLILCVNLVQV